VLNSFPKTPRRSTFRNQQTYELAELFRISQSQSHCGTTVTAPTLGDAVSAVLSYRPAGRTVHTRASASDQQMEVSPFTPGHFATYHAFNIVLNGALSPLLALQPPLASNSIACGGSLTVFAQVLHRHGFGHKNTEPTHPEEVIKSCLHIPALVSGSVLPPSKVRISFLHGTTDQSVCCNCASIVGCMRMRKDVHSAFYSLQRCWPAVVLRHTHTATTTETAPTRAEQPSTTNLQQLANLTHPQV